MVVGAAAQHRAKVVQGLGVALVVVAAALALTLGRLPVLVGPGAK